MSVPTRLWIGQRQMTIGVDEFTVGDRIRWTATAGGHVSTRLVGARVAERHRPPPRAQIPGWPSGPEIELWVDCRQEGSAPWFTVGGAVVAISSVVCSWVLRSHRSPVWRPKPGSTSAFEVNGVYLGGGGRPADMPPDSVLGYLVDLRDAEVRPVPVPQVAPRRSAAVERDLPPREGLSWAEGRVLAVVASSADGLNIWEIGHVLGVADQRIRTLVASLVSQGLVERSGAAGQVRLTDVGRRAVRSGGESL